MLNSLTASRRIAYLMVTVQFVVAMLVALAFLAQSSRSALAAAIVGSSVALGSLVHALRSLPATPKSAGWALSRMVSGLLLKWFIVFGALFLAMAKLHLPPLPMIVALAATMAASLLTLNSKA